MSEPQRNPFSPHYPVVDPARFFGRQDVFSFIRERLVTQQNNQAVAIIGQRGIGKTSLLLNIPHQIDARYVVAFVDLLSVNLGQSGGVFVAMADAARIALESAGLSTEPLPDLPPEIGQNRADLWAWFSQAYLSAALAALRDERRLVFLFDDTSALLDARDRGDVPPDIGAALVSLIADDPRIDTMFAVDSHDEYRLEGFEPLSDPLLHRRLPMLDVDSAEALIRVPASPDYQIDADAVEMVLSMAGGHPALLQVLNALIWERSAARQHAGLVTAEDVTQVLPQAVEEAQPILEAMLADCSPNELAVLSATTHLTAQTRGQPVNPDDLRIVLSGEQVVLDETGLAAALRGLEYRELLHAAPIGYTFTVGLLYQWLNSRDAALEAGSAAARHQQRPQRRLWIPLLVMIAAAIAGVAFISQLTRTPGDSPAAVQRTVTLGMNIQATQQAVDETATFLAIPTNTPTPTATDTPTATVTASSTPSATATDTATVSPTVTNTPTATESPSATASVTNTATPPVLITATALIVVTAAPPTSTTQAIIVPTASATVTGTNTPPPSWTPSTTPTATGTATASFTATTPPTATFTSSATRTPSPTVTPTRPSATPSRTPTRTPSPMASRIPVTAPPFPTAQFGAPTSRP